ncbi:MAG: AbrB/MazE/SpoVT family DNA-binding domain-containing protein [Anaerolineales bacterium]|nr:MAG: AbrB/MazE/SpoVT family DNA-binding domain-containing protein [Anaerolineales bacterium]
MKTYISTKGQLVIPAKLRRKYGIKPGTRIQVIDRGNQIVLQPITEEYIRKLRGSLKGGNALRVLEEERRKDQER